MTRIVVLDGATLNPGDNPWTRLEQLGDVQIFDRTAPEDVVVRGRPDATVLVINKVRLPRRAAAPAAGPAFRGRDGDRL